MQNCLSVADWATTGPEVTHSVQYLAPCVMRRVAFGKPRKKLLVFITVFCAVIVFVWDRPSTPSDDDVLHLHGGAYSQAVKSIENVLRFARDQEVNPCTGQPRPPLTKVPAFPSSPEVSLKHNLLYCPAGKVGSSFFTRILIALNLAEPPHKDIPSPFTIPISQAGRERSESLDTLELKDQKLVFLQTSERVVFGRDPYRRIFSAWLDKLYSPNPFYWMTWGALARGLQAHTVCEPNITFRQFVRLVVRPKGLYRSDVHLRPVADECKMCELQYTLVGKIEKTTENLDILASRINVSMPFLHEQGYQEASGVDTVLDAVEGAFSWRDDILACGVSLDRMGRSIWRKLQIRGVIDSSQSYPFKSRDLHTLTAAANFTEACITAIKNSRDRVRLRRQKEVALVQAYSQVDPRDLLKISFLYHKDFFFFGYDKKPDAIFRRFNLTLTNSARVNSTTPGMGVFDWSKDWVL